MTQQTSYYRQVSAKKDHPNDSGWYNTDKGELFWFNDYKVWSCREERISEEYPAVFYEPVVPLPIIAEEILEEFLRPLSESEEDFEDYIKDNKEQIAAIVSAMKEYASRFTLHNPKEEDTARAKAKKWDDLEEKIGKLYDSESSDICEVGEVAATAFGFI